MSADSVDDLHYAEDIIGPALDEAEAYCRPTCGHLDFGECHDDCCGCPCGHATYTADRARVGAFTAYACRDNEAVFVGSHAYFWDVEDATGTRVESGWAASPSRARRAALKAAQRLHRTTCMKARTA